MLGYPNFARWLVKSDRLAGRLAAVTSTPDIRLIAIDLDGTLLDSSKRLDPSFGPLLAELQRSGVVVAPASGRQHESIRQALAPGVSEAALDQLVILAENGALVARAGEVLATQPLPEGAVASVAGVVANHVGAGGDVGVVMSGALGAYYTRPDADFERAIAGYYPLRTSVDDLLAVDDVPLKLAVWEGAGVEHSVYPPIRDAAPAGARVLVSGQVWVDVMGTTADKGHALADLQKNLGITPAQTMAFGDYGNDIGMLKRAEWSYAMAGAHPDVKAVARYLAPSNDEAGVTRTIAEVLGL